MITVGFDAIHDNVSHLPAGSQAAGYTTGSQAIRWTSADWAKFPTAVRIDQDFAAADPSADVLDVESGAATFADCPAWAKKAMADFASAVRPGQRAPAVYTSAVNVTSVANALVNGGVMRGVGLWVANWNLTEAQAIADVQSASGPFPIVGVQYSSGTYYDYDTWASPWLTTVSGAPAAAVNPVGNLRWTVRGFTSVELAWDAQSAATSYDVKTYWRGTQLGTPLTVTSASARVGHLTPRRTYEFRVRAHPGGSTGADASLHVTTR